MAVVCLMLLAVGMACTVVLLLLRVTTLCCGLPYLSILCSFGYVACLVCANLFITGMAMIMFPAAAFLGLSRLVFELSTANACAVRLMEYQYPTDEQLQEFLAPIVQYAISKMITLFNQLDIEGQFKEHLEESLKCIMDNQKVA